MTRIKVDKTFVTHTHSHKHTHTYTHTLASGGVEVGTEKTRGWVRQVCFSGAGSGLHSTNEPGMPEQYPAARLRPRCISSHQGGKNRRAKFLLEVLVQFLQVIHAYGPVARLIGDATAPGIQPA